MKWYKDLYLGELVTSDAKNVIRKIKHNKFVPGVYVIAYRLDSLNLLDIIPAWELIQVSYPKDTIRVIGLAFGKTEALDLVREIVDETYQVTGSVDVKQYLKGKWRDEQWK